MEFNLKSYSHVCRTNFWGYNGKINIYYKNVDVLLWHNTNIVATCIV